MSRNVQYVTDAEGNKMAVILPIEEYEELMEDLHLSRLPAERRDEPRRAFTEVVEELCSGGEIMYSVIITSHAAREGDGHSHLTPQ